MICFVIENDAGIGTSIDPFEQIANAVQVMGFLRADDDQSSRAQVLLFGGACSWPPCADTWVWDGGNWTQKLPNVSALPNPLGRVSHALAYDAVSARVLLFGGYGDTSNGWTDLSDTWVWNQRKWMQTDIQKHPGPRANHAMAGDAARQMVLFGGWDVGAQQLRNDTWVWAGQ